MTDAAHAPEAVDPYATLQHILKVINRSWLTEEWRLEDIRLLAQAAISFQGNNICEEPRADGPAFLTVGGSS